MSNAAAITVATAEHHLATVETFRFSQDQRKLILDTCCGGASAQEAAVLIGIAEMRGLNPITQECYFVQRWDNAKRCQVWAVQVSIDAMRIKAEESGVYSGQDEPEYEYEPGSKVPSLARVKVWRRDWDRPSVGVARFSEYVQKTKEGVPTKFWRDMPHNQLAKCAEALALRKAFPRRLAKLYTADEMAQATNEAPEREELVGSVSLAPARPPSTPPPALVEGGQSSALWSAFTAELSQAMSKAEVKAIGLRIKDALGAQKLTLTQSAQLRDLVKARNKVLPELSAPPPAPVGEVLAGNELPSSWGGPAIDDEPAVCAACGHGVGADRLRLDSEDGEVRLYHPGCHPPVEPPVGPRPPSIPPPGASPQGPAQAPLAATAGAPSVACGVCRKPVGTAVAMPFRGPSGGVLMRHPACSPPREREPGEEG